MECKYLYNYCNQVASTAIEKCKNFSVSLQRRELVDYRSKNMIQGSRLQTQDLSHNPYIISLLLFDQKRFAVSIYLCDPQR